MQHYGRDAIKTPSNFGLAFADLATATDQTSRHMYVIEIDDNPRDFSTVPKIYGAYWATSPDPVNEIAKQLWPEFGAPEYRDEEDNVDGKTTARGECYQSSACLGIGQKFLSLSVRRIRQEADLRNFRR